MINLDALSLQDICKKCGVRCCTEPGPPIVFPDEAVRIGEFAEKNGLRDHIEPIEGEEFFTIPRRDGPCPYLADGECTIQAVKPLDCRVYPIGLQKSLRTGISRTCPAKNLLSKEYVVAAEGMLNRRSPEEKSQLASFAEREGYEYDEAPLPYGWNLSLDLYGCRKETISSKQSIERYLREIVPLIDMIPVGDPIIPEKFGKGSLHGYSAIQFIQTSSVVAHFSEDILEAHIDIFSCKGFDASRATEFTKAYFEAEKVRERFFER